VAIKVGNGVVPLASVTIDKLSSIELLYSALNFLVVVAVEGVVTNNGEPVDGTDWRDTLTEGDEERDEEADVPS
jgi:hypothetical protein